MCACCLKNFKAKMSTAKYCPDKPCKKYESLFRISKGYIFKIEKPLKNGLIEFYNEQEVRSKNPFVPNPFAFDIKAYILTKTKDEMLLPWKHEFGNKFILYYFPHLKKQYDLFYGEKIKREWNKYEFLFLK